MKKLTIALLLLTLLSAVAQEQSEDQKKDINYNVVVTATLEETATNKVGSSVTVLTAGEIERLQARTVLEALRFVPGIDIVQNGGAGGTASVFIRGAKSEQTLLMIDGVEMNDIISPTRTFDFAHLTTENIERIEVIRGPQSVLFGSDAIGGVINIITRKGDGEFSGKASFEGGSYAAYRGSASLAGSGDGFTFSASASRMENDGFSAADGELEGNSEEDGYENSSVSARLGLKPNDKAGVDLFLRYTDASAQIDSGGGAFGDDPNNIVDTESLALRGEGRALMLDNALQLIAGVAYSSTERSQENGTDPDHPLDSVEARYTGDLVTFDGRAILQANEAVTITAGIETQEETGSSEYMSDGFFGPYTDIFEEQSVRTTSFFGMAAVENEGLNSTLGFRYDDHELFGEKTTWRATMAYNIPGAGTIVRSSFGTGFKAPSLFQLYSSFGSQELLPEESSGFDIGVEQSFCEGKASLGANWFYTTLENMIDFDSLSFSYANIAEAKSQGLELYGYLRISDQVEAAGSYTYTDATDETTEEQLLRRARHKANARVSVFISPETTLTLSGNYAGTRQDETFAGFSSERIELEDFFLLDIAGSYKVAERCTVFGRLHNLFDQDYEWVSGYATAGLSGYFGATLEF